MPEPYCGAAACMAAPELSPISNAQGARILIIDNYDSYTLNLLQLLPQALACQVVVIENDQFDWPTLRDDVLPYFDGVIISPGPGTPERPSDMGVVMQLLEHPEIPPVLGVCLGHQAIAKVFGGKVVHAQTPVHGQQSAVDLAMPNASELFRGIPSPFSVVRYHSLVVDESALPDCMVPLGYTYDKTLAGTSGDGMDRVLMALKHRSLPLYGVQFHPESICTEYGQRLMANFIDIVMNWRPDRPLPRPPLPNHIKQLCTTVAYQHTTALGASSTRPQPTYSIYVQSLDYIVSAEDAFCQLHAQDEASVWLDSARLNDRQSLSSLIGSCRGPGSFQLEYRLSEKELCFRYYDSDAHAAMTERKHQLPASDTLWQWLSDWLAQFKDAPVAYDVLSNASTTYRAGRRLPTEFHTGLVGYFGYEMKREALHGYADHTAPVSEPSTLPSLSASETAAQTPDAAFLFLDRFVAFDTVDGAVWLVGLVRDGDDAASGPAPPVGMSRTACLQWMRDTDQTLRAKRNIATPAMPMANEEGPAGGRSLTKVQTRCRDTHQAYLDKIRVAQSFIRDGESYELCLTTQMSLSLPRPLAYRLPSNNTTHTASTLAFYRHLRCTNPAPYAAYLNLGPALCIASASPERFLRVTAQRTIQMRPIKGTCRRQRTCCCTGSDCRQTSMAPGRDPLCAQRRDQQLRDALAADIKERGENLMIVDLIRNDLARICRPYTVHVPQLMAVETYETVHQMVTTVDGQLRAQVDAVRALQSCFPPGSMTGAPKLRSVQLLEHLEQQAPRGIYSGCLGFLSITGSADFNVVIRTAVIRDGQNVNIGAGGAITILSSPEEEWQEMFVKAESVLPSIREFVQTL